MDVEEVEKKMFYSISEVSDLLQINQSQIRFWEKEFSVLKPKKNKKGNRQFTDSDIQLLKQIQYLVKEQGYTLAGANEKLKNEKHLEGKRVDVVNTLKSIKSLLLEIKETLDS